ncbi:F plasmid transfer operon protein TraF [Alteromonadaceae bacterium 2753L.S.0a.02]|nr:F plasmid transfer operon protein TraF [Alteromonadaceae bacterium 2753L.S.0a.02]
MNKVFRQCLLALAVAPLASTALAGGAQGTSGKTQTLGAVSGDSSLVGTYHNPASGIYAAKHTSGTVRGELAYGVQLEYGDVQDLFDLVDELSGSLTDEPSGGDGGNGDNGGDNGSDLGSIGDIENPQLEELINRVADEASRIGAVLALVATEGYARGNLGAQLSVLINKNIAGGVLSFDYVASGTYGVVGVADEINFDADAALAALTDAYNLNITDEAQTFDITGGIFLTVDPATQRASVEFDNDSLLLTRGVRLQEFVLGYSRPAFESDAGTLSWGVAPKLIIAGLTDTAVRIGDITDSEKLFEDILDAEFKTDNGVGMNAGVFWDAGFYHLGASVQNLTETEFSFPNIDTSNYSNPEIIRRIEESRTRKLERQLRLEGGLGKNGWNLNAAYDTQSAKDLLGFEYQWASISGGYHSKSWWIPGFRLGYHKNMAGSKLSYMAAGISLFKFFNLDFSLTNSSVTIDGDELPRGADLSFGFNYQF